MKELSEFELRQFAKAQYKKHTLMWGFATDPSEELENVILNVVVDTQLLLTGAVPLERWLESEGAAPK